MIVKKYYACYRCHDSLENHPFEPYPLSLIQDKPILCGVCLKLLTYKQYKESLSCPFVFLALIQVAKIIRNAILNSKSSSFEVGENSIPRENEVNLPTIKRIISRLFNT